MNSIRDIQSITKIMAGKLLLTLTQEERKWTMAQAQLLCMVICKPLGISGKGQTWEEIVQCGTCTPLYKQYDLYKM
jgi:hypothetical protein